MSNARVNIVERVILLAEVDTWKKLNTASLFKRSRAIITNSGVATNPATAVELRYYLKDSSVADAAPTEYGVYLANGQSHVLDIPSDVNIWVMADIENSLITLTEFGRDYNAYN